MSRRLDPTFVFFATFAFIVVAILLIALAIAFLN